MKAYLAAVLVLLSASAAYGQADSGSGEQLFKQYCGSCHGASGHPRLAPPVMGLRQHLLKAFPEKEAFVQHVANWVADPDPVKALMKHAVERFGPMPKQVIAKEDAEKIAAYLYETEQGCKGCKGMRAGHGQGEHGGHQHSQNGEGGEHQH